MIILRLLSAGFLLSSLSFGAGPRTLVRLDTGWRFHRGDEAGASAAVFDDSSWQRISIPHTWNTEGDPPRAGYYRGPGWYRRQFPAPPNWKGQRVFARFEGASLVARAFLNGKDLGEHKGGFQAFCFEVTPYLQLGAGNLLAVRVDNARREDVIPLGGDFTVFGGIYRPVSLIVTAPVNITPLDYGSPGVFLKQPDVNAGHAAVEAVAEVSNESGAARNVEVLVTVLDADNQKVTSVRQRTELSAGETKPVTQNLRIEKPHLWNGVADPYLYTARVEIFESGRLVDAVDQPLGLRSFQVDPARGAILNGKPQQIRGVCRHQDWGGLGWAIGEKEQDTDLQIMREMGVTGVRLAHYQHNDYFYRLCDRKGLLVWAELAMVNDLRGTPAFLEGVRQQLTELIRQNLNHPSIVMWSLYNELSPSNKDNPVPIVDGLRRLARKEDPGRVTTGAFSIDGIEKLPAVGRISELMALNVYPGWYIATPSAMGSIIDKWNAFYGSKGIIISEYGAGASIQQHQQDFTERAAGRAPKDWHPEEWQTNVHEGNYAAIQSRPYVPASFLWSMFDFASAGRKEGGMPGVNDKGLVTRDRKIRKDAFYFYQANWTTGPMVYITSRRDADRSASETPVKVYSNLPKVTLRVNGKSYGEMNGSDLHVFLWKTVPLVEGENRIQAEAASSSGVVRDSCIWTYHPKGSG
ncbi:MAG: glycoside hydrolase family 2 TIM barrel-domain containing protein [Bryobacteraceae bacterium]